MSAVLTFDVVIQSRFTTVSERTSHPHLRFGERYTWNSPSITAQIAH